MALEEMLIGMRIDSSGVADMRRMGVRMRRVRMARMKVGDVAVRAMPVTPFHFRQVLVSHFTHLVHVALSIKGLLNPEIRPVGRR
jgi:hypothetical protein